MLTYRFVDVYKLYVKIKNSFKRINRRKLVRISEEQNLVECVLSIDKNISSS